MSIRRLVRSLRRAEEAGVDRERMKVGDPELARALAPSPRPWDPRPLPRRLAACRQAIGFTWRPGMRLRVWGSGDAGWFRVKDGTCHTGNLEADLSDGATLGCLRELAREVLKAPQLYCKPTASGWIVMKGGAERVGLTPIVPTEEEALIVVLEGATA